MTYHDMEDPYSPVRAVMVAFYNTIMDADDIAIKNATSGNVISPQDIRDAIGHNNLEWFPKEKVNQITIVKEGINAQGHWLHVEVPLFRHRDKIGHVKVYMEDEFDGLWLKKRLLDLVLIT